MSAVKLGAAGMRSICSSWARHPTFKFFKNPIKIIRHLKVNTQWFFSSRLPLSREAVKSVVRNEASSTRPNPTLFSPWKLLSSLWEILFYNNIIKWETKQEVPWRQKRVRTLRNQNRYCSLAQLVTRVSYFYCFLKHINHCLYQWLERNYTPVIKQKGFWI